MGRKTACSREEWKELTGLLGKGLAKKLREKYGGKIDVKTWNETYARALREAARLSVTDCDVQRIVNEVLSKF